MDEKRQALWNTGKYVAITEHIKCNRESCRVKIGVREFDFGFFCYNCFMKLVECSEPGCENLTTADSEFMEGRCRTCEFEYEGELVLCTESVFSEAEIWASGKLSRKEINDAADRFLKKHNVKTPDPSKNWFPG